MERLRRTPSPSSVPASLPVLFFGDRYAAKAATVALNPSRLEYLDDQGLELAGSERRFETLSSLGGSSRGSLTVSQARHAIDQMRNYFHGNVYTGWFTTHWRVLEGAGHDYRHDAVHLDLVQEATDPTWLKLTNVNPGEHDALRTQDIPFLGWLIETFPVHLLLADGKTALDEVAEVTEADLELLRTLGTREVEVYTGTGRLPGGEVLVGGWNRPLAFAGPHQGLSAGEYDRRRAAPRAMTKPDREEQMGNGEASNSVQLFYMRDESGVQSVTASITQEGDLTLESWDYGRAVSDTLGSESREWEHICTVRSAHVPTVRDALGGKGDEDVLSLLAERLDQESSRRPSAWLKHHDIPFDQWSWTTD